MAEPENRLQLASLKLKSRQRESILHILPLFMFHAKRFEVLNARPFCLSLWINL